LLANMTLVRFKPSTSMLPGECDGERIMEIG